MNRFVVAVLLGLWVSLCGASVEAIEPCPARPARKQDATTLASQWFVLGDRYVGEGKFQFGKEAFECSYSLVAHPASLFNAALAAQKAANTIDACDLFSQYLSVSNDEAKKYKVIKILDELDCDSRDDNVDYAPTGTSYENGTFLYDASAKPTSHLVSKFDADRKPDASTQVPFEGPHPDRKATGRSGGNVNTTEKQSSLVPRFEVGKYEDEAHARNVLWSSGFVVMGVGEAGIATGVVFQVLAGYAARKGNQTEDLDVHNKYQSDNEKFQTAAVVAFVSGALVFITGLTMYLASRKRHQNEEKSRRSNMPILFVFDGLKFRGSF